MPRLFLKKILPHPDKFKKDKHLLFLGKFLKNKRLWNINRKSILSAIFIGTFISWMPIPGHMIMAAALSIIFKNYLPISVTLVWISNPFTFSFIFYAAYKTGSYILDSPPMDISFTMESIGTSLGTAFPPFALGCLVLGFLNAILFYIIADFWWVYKVKSRASKRLN